MAYYKIVQWIKRNKIILVVVVLFLLFFGKNFFTKVVTPAPSYPITDIGTSTKMSVGMVSNSYNPVAPTEGTDRLVVQEPSLSLVVKDVKSVADKIEATAKDSGGYMVSTSLTKTQEVPFATIVIRTPADKLKDTLDLIRGMSTKVSSEYVLGTDVTDQYVDIDARLETLNQTKAKFETILQQSTVVSDLLNVQREIINLQTQIDSLKGQQKYLEQTAKLAKVTVYLSSDEFSLPYVPAQTFRPSVIFKLAVRSLVGTLRSLATLLIWIFVYAVILVPVVLIIYFLRRKFRKV